MIGMNGYVEICKLSKDYLHHRNHELDERIRYKNMKNILKKMYDIMGDENVSEFLPKVLLSEIQESITRVIIAIDKLAQIKSDTSLTKEEKDKRIKKAMRDLAKEEHEMNKQMDNAFYAFVSSMRLEKTFNGMSDDELDDYIVSINSEDSLTIEEKKAITNEIKDIKAEKTSKLEARRGKTNKSVYEEFNMDVDASKVSAKEGLNYRSSVIFASISRRLQQLSVEIAKLQSDDSLEFSDKVQLQAKLLEQAELTKELIKLKKKVKTTIKDIQLKNKNKRINKTESKLAKLNGKTDTKSLAKRDRLNNKLIKLLRKRGSISFDIKKYEILRLSKKASKIRKNNNKKAFRFLSVDNFLNNDHKFKPVLITAIPQYIKITSRKKLEEEMNNVFKK